MKKQKTHLNKQKLEEFRKILLEEKAKILQTLEKESEFYINEEEGDEVDVAEVKLNNALISRLSDMEIERLKMIERALEKIEDGTYGICEGTGMPIPEERLRAIPWTLYTVEYAEKLKKEKKKR
jgi:RNA polymerase-binding protein DksA